MASKWHKYSIYDICDSEMITFNNQREIIYENTPRTLLFKFASSITIKIPISPTFVINKNGFKDRKIDAHHCQS